jgi:hypothetical protein
LIRVCSLQMLYILSISLYLSTYLSRYLSVCPPGLPYTCLYICVICLSACPSVRPSVPPSLSLSVYLCLSTCICVFLLTPYLTCMNTKASVCHNPFRCVENWPSLRGWCYRVGEWFSLVRLIMPLSLSYW